MGNLVRAYLSILHNNFKPLICNPGERSGLVVEPRIPERDVVGSIPNSTVLCP